MNAMSLTVAGVHLSYAEQGSGTPLVLLHAFPLSGEMWAPQVAALTGLARVIVPDLRGFGRSNAPAGPYTMDQYAADTVALLDHLGVEKAVVGGLSMGGYIALALARRHPERLHALILSDTRAQADTAEGRAERHRHAELVESAGPGALADLLLPRMVGATTAASRPELVARARQMIVSNQPTGIAGALLGMAERPDSVPVLGTVSCPALVIVGAEDVGTPPADAEIIHHGIAGSRLAVIPAAGHLSNLENPDAWNAAVRTFLESLPAA